MPDHESALKPEDITRLFVERANAGDAEGIAALYETDAVMAYPPGKVTVGCDATRMLWEAVLTKAPRFEQELSLTTLIIGDIALTSSVAIEEVQAPVQRWSAGN